MAEDVKILRELCAQIQAGSSFESASMQLLPLNNGFPMQEFDSIDNNAIAGTAFRDIPQQGMRHVAGSPSFNLDKTSSQVLFEAAFGNVTSQVYTLPSGSATANVKKLSMAGLDSVKSNQYANVYVTRLSISGSENQILTMDVDLVGVTAEDRQAVGNQPSASGYDADPFVFHELGGTNGYVRLGDASNALASGDNINIESFDLEIVTGFDEQGYNNLGTLTPVFGMVPPSVSGSLVISRHDTDQYQTWAEARTPLQLALYAYKSATATLLIEIPRLIVKPEITDEDTPKINLELMIGRNGIGTNYANGNMEFNSPIRVTVIDS
jgi:hypothetical protein